MGLFSGLYIFIIISHCSAQDATNRVLENSSYFSALDSALSAIRMDRSDIVLSRDYVARDPFRLTIVENLFPRPLDSVNIADSLAQAISKHYSDPDSLFSAIAEIQDIPWEPPRIESRAMPADLQNALIMLKKEAGSDSFLTRSEQERLRKIPDKIALLLAPWLVAATEAHRLIKQASDVFSLKERVFVGEFAHSNLSRESEGNPGDIESIQMNLAKLRENELETIRKQKEFVQIVSKYDRLSLIKAAYLIYSQHTKNLLEQLAAEAASLEEAIYFPTRLGEIAIGTQLSDHYDKDYLLIIDPCGDDLYTGGISVQPDSLLFGNGFIRVIYDAGGNDVYRGQDYCQGAGVNGVGLLIDKGGDDVYSARQFCQGAGLFGVGMLIDEAGDDAYHAETGAQGFGAFGFGMLVDLDGSDLRQAQFLSQGVGYCQGFGFLFDRKGYDRYVTQSTYSDILRNADHTETLSQGFGYGMRPYGSGGIGILYDQTGNDLYFADVFGQGSSYWFGFGALIDDHGSDIYSGFDYCQGSGVHLSFGVCLDRSGNDNYRAWGISQGSGHDLAFGTLVDISGDDNYVCQDLSQGGGNANGFSLFVDLSGNDGHIAKGGRTLGYSDTRRTYGMAGIFLDLGGKDFYGSPYGENDAFWTHSTYGVGLDQNKSKKPQAELSEEKNEPDFPEPLGEDVPTLFLQASAAVASYQPIVQPARERLIEMGIDSLGYLLDKLDTEHPREYHALRAIIPKIGKETISILSDSLSSENPRTVSNSIWFMGLVGDSSAAPHLEKFLTHEKRSIRVHCAEALGRSKHPAYESALISLLADSEADVRQRAAWALGRFGTEKSFSPLLQALKDSRQIVRHSAENSLASLHSGLDPQDKDSKILRKRIHNALKNADFPNRQHLIRMLGRADDCQNPKNLGEIKKFLQSDVWESRAAAVEALGYIKHEKAKDILEDIDLSQEHPRVRTAVESILSK